MDRRAYPEVNGSEGVHSFPQTPDELLRTTINPMGLEGDDL